MENETYKGWLVSNSLIKRSLAVIGHSIVGQIIIGIPFLILFVLFMLAVAF